MTRPDLLQYLTWRHIHVATLIVKFLCIHTLPYRFDHHPAAEADYLQMEWIASLVH